MKEFYVPSLLELSKEIGRLVRHFETFDDDEKLTDEAKATYQSAFNNHRETFDNLDLRLCKKQCERILGGIEQPVSGLSKMLEELQRRMEDECENRLFLALSEKQASLIFPDLPLFGDEVDKKYPSAAFEIAEAGKCLGLERTTAAVFHLMRAMEIGIASAARCLGIPDPVKPSQRNWGAILKSFKAELERRGNALPATWANPDKDFFEDVYVSLDAVRNPWRNSTMHVDSRYDQDEAEHIFMAVRAFIRKLASRMDEEGKPLA